MSASRPARLPQDIVLTAQKNVVITYTRSSTTEYPGAYVTGHRVLADYLLLVRFAPVAELTVFCGALVGASLGFLWYNAYPAEIFMGDVGSLALGAALGTVAGGRRRQMGVGPDRPHLARRLLGGRVAPDRGGPRLPRPPALRSADPDPLGGLRAGGPGPRWAPTSWAPYSSLR